MTKATGGPVDDVLAKLSKKYAVNAGEICLRWCIDQDVVAITTSSKEQRLSDYLRAMTFKLTPAEVKQVSFIPPTLLASPALVFVLEGSIWTSFADFSTHSADQRGWCSEALQRILEPQVRRR